MVRDLSDGYTKPLPDMSRLDPEMLPHGPLCARCYSEDALDNHVEFACSHDPRAPSDAPGIGMYHCPDCDAMVLAGHHHGPVCRHCAETVGLFRRHVGVERRG
jgi:hypothetical protein